MPLFVMSPIEHSSDTLTSIKNNKEQIFELIDSIISLESCLHYQFLPLELKNNVLTLGMINSKDRNGYNFIYPIVTSLNYILKIVEISSETHQLILAEYLKRDLSDLPSENPQSNPLNNSSGSKLNSSQTIVEVPIDSPHNNNQTRNLHDRATLIINPQEESKFNNDSHKNKIASSSPEIFSSEPQITNFNSLEVSHYSDSSTSNLLEVQAEYINKSTDILSSLEPKKLWQELLARILDGGIGRLYLERHLYHGKIIWSKDGVLQSSLEEVKIEVFDRLIQEIKILGKQPLNPIDKTRKIAIEKVYNQERILLRIEFFLNQYGEEITIQILRDKALKFYERRQVKRTMEQALSLSHKLEKNLKKVMFCGNSTDVDINNIKSLKSKLKTIEKQILLLEKKAKNPQR